MSLFNYTTGNALEYNSSNYIGYYNILSGAITTDKIYTSSSVILSAQNTAIGNFIADELTFNFNPLTDISLPNTLDSIKFTSNEIINANSLNVRFNKIIDNYFELFKRCSVLTNNIPTGYTSYAAISSVSSTQIGWLPSLSTVAFSLSTINNNLTAINGISLLNTNNNSINNLVVETPAGYFIYNFNDTLFTFAASAYTTDSISNIAFKNISSVVSDNVGNLYISDITNKQIYKISIAATTNNSRVNLNNPRMLEVIGTIEQPSVMYYNGGELFIYDNATFTVFVYDSNLTYIRKYSNKKFFSNNAPVSMGIDNTSGILYVLTNLGEILKIDKSLLGDINIVSLGIDLTTNESFSHISFSKNNSNIVYISTNMNMYKLFVDRLPLLVGKFIWVNTNISNVTNLQFDILDTTENYDYIVIYINNRFLLFKESNNLINTLENVSYKIHNSGDILLSDEYFNNITFNSAITKLLHNHDILVSYLQSRYVYTYNNKHLTLSSVSILGESTLSALNVVKDYDYFAGVNESVSPQVFNRIIGKIIDYQHTIAGTLQPLITNTKNPITQVVKF